MKRLVFIPILALMFLTSCAALNALMIDEEEVNRLITDLRTDTIPHKYETNRGFRMTKAKDVEKAFIATDIDAFCDAIKALLYRDFDVIKKLERDKKIFWFGEETHVVIVSTNKLKYWVRIQDGPNEGQRGWIYPLMLNVVFTDIGPIYPDLDIRFKPIASSKDVNKDKD